MTTQYSADICRRLQAKFKGLGLLRPMRISHYDAGTELTYTVTGIEKKDTATVRLLVERFVGGGFAGQVYQVKILDIHNVSTPIKGLERGGVYAMKILVPPSGFSRLFRNFLYAVGFQGPFQLQVNPAAARSGALWQKFIRRAAKIRFGDEKAVVDVHATFKDEKIGSCGELSEWVEGRTWRLEVDERMDVLKLWRRGKKVDADLLGSPEYRAKKQFMHDLVKLFHDLGAYELARQYEWSTCKSQPNCLKRYDTNDAPTKGLTAVDFRPGLVLLPFLPMSPGDFKLIAKGIRHGALVQFDRGDVSKLESFVRAHKEHFAGFEGMLDELKADERIYRDSTPDITHNGIRLLYNKRLWSTMLDSALTGWKVRNLIDDGAEKKFRTGRLKTVLFFILGLIPIFGKISRKLWTRGDWRRHYAAIFSNPRYLGRAVVGKIIEKSIDWYRGGRISELQTIRIAQQPWRFFYHLPFLLLLFPGLHRFFTDSEYRKEKLVFVFVRPFRLYFHAAMREQWLREMVAEGQKKNMLSDDDARTIVSQVNEPYIQKYLVSLVVHLLMMPTTHVVAIICAIVYVLMHPEMPRTEAWAVGLGIIVFFQIIPISPGSLCRGFYVLYLVIKERNVKDYNIAIFLAFFKYIGYLAFPIQMTYRYPILARFMAGHWATEIVHIVPVFGERGALLEHWVYGLFYNWPLTVRRRMKRRAEIRETIAPRYWHAGICVLPTVLIFYLAGFIHLNEFAKMEGPYYIKCLVAITLLLCGAVITIGCGDAKLVKRIITAAVSGALIGMLSISMDAIINHPGKVTVLRLLSLLMISSRYAFIFALLCTIGAVVTELMLPDPDLNK